jgi:hypothetical protein
MISLSARIQLAFGSGLLNIGMPGPGTGRSFSIQRWFLAAFVRHRIPLSFKDLGRKVEFI